MKAFNYQQDFKHINFRQHPELYQVGRGEQGVLMVEPYKSEILPHWRFKTPKIAKTSALAIMALFENYRQNDDFVGMDMARKFIQMGYTRARRYANYPGGRKYAEDKTLNPRNIDDEKAASAAIFKGYWDQLRADADYLKRKKAHQQQYG
ncbi:cytoplasmic protein [Serratia sp. Leaf50]|nr:cytoplasmic protein [Serratia sp. Leaf50]